MFGGWLSNQNKRIRNLIWVGVAAIYWAIWRCRNDVIFNQMKSNSIMQVISEEHTGYELGPRCSMMRQPQTHSQLSKKLEVIALELSNKGWKHIYCLI